MYIFCQPFPDYHKAHFSLRHDFSYWYALISMSITACLDFTISAPNLRISHQAAMMPGGCAESSSLVVLQVLGGAARTMSRYQVFGIEFARCCFPVGRTPPAPTLL